MMHNTKKATQALIVVLAMSLLPLLLGGTDGYVRRGNAELKIAILEPTAPENSPILQWSIFNEGPSSIEVNTGAPPVFIELIDDKGQLITRKSFWSGPGPGFTFDRKSITLDVNAKVDGSMALLRMFNLPSSGGFEVRAYLVSREQSVEGFEQRARKGLSASGGGEAFAVARFHTSPIAGDESRKPLDQVKEATLGDLRLFASSDVAKSGVGGPIWITLQVQNVSGRSITLPRELSGGEIPFWVLVEDEGGKISAPYLRIGKGTSIVERVTVEPARLLKFSCDLTSYFPFLKAGKYKVTAHYVPDVNELKTAVLSSRFEPNVKFEFSQSAQLNMEMHE